MPTNQFTEFLTKLRLLGVFKVTVDFQGGGDSGEIQQAAFYNAQDQDITMDLMHYTMAWEETYTEYPPLTDAISITFPSIRPESVVKTRTNDLGFEEIMQKLVEQHLESTGLDWYNNNGGQGAFIIDFSTSPPSIKLVVGVNYTSTEEHVFDLEHLYKPENEDIQHD